MWAFWLVRAGSCFQLWDCTAVINGNKNTFLVCYRGYVYRTWGACIPEEFWNMEGSITLDIARKIGASKKYWTFLKRLVKCQKQIIFPGSSRGCWKLSACHMRLRFQTFHLFQRTWKAYRGLLRKTSMCLHFSPIIACPLDYGSCWKTVQLDTVTLQLCAIHRVRVLQRFREWKF